MHEGAEKQTNRSHNHSIPVSFSHWSFSIPVLILSVVWLLWFSGYFGIKFTLWLYVCLYIRMYSNCCFFYLLFCIVLAVMVWYLNCKSFYNNFWSKTLSSLFKQTILSCLACLSCSLSILGYKANSFLILGWKSKTNQIL